MNNLQNNVTNNEELINAYIGKNIEEIRKGNFSWCTFFFDVVYAFYRKMWLFGIVYLLSYLVCFTLIIVLIVLLVKQTNELAFIQNAAKYYSIIYVAITLTALALRLIFPFKFKKSYLKHATKKVEQIKVQNMGKSNQEIKEVCTKKGGTSILGIFLAIILPLVSVTILVTVPASIKTKEILDDAEEQAAIDSAYVIIKSVELAHIDALLTFIDKKESITLEDIRNRYEGMSSTWNDDNTITTKLYDVVCNVTVNNDNKMQVSCDVNGETIESELLDLNIENISDDNQDNGTNKEENKETPNDSKNEETKKNILSSDNKCINDNTKCPSGTMGNVKVNDAEEYKFYVLADTGTKLTLIMDRNLGDNVAWFDDG